MSLRDKILNMRMNEFGFSKVTYLFSDKDDFPNRIHIVKWQTMDKPYEIYSLNEKKYVKRSEFCYVIAELEWNEHEDGWDFNSIGTRYLEDGTEELSKWILDFCNKYRVEDGELVEVQYGE